MTLTHFGTEITSIETMTAATAFSVMSVDLGMEDEVVFAVDVLRNLQKP